MNLHTIDVNGLRNFYKYDSAARLILESLAGRQNNWKMTTVSSLVSVLTLAGNDISRKQTVNVFREFQRFNCGEFVIGKMRGNRNFQSRFIGKSVL